MQKAIVEIDIRKGKFAYIAKKKVYERHMCKLSKTNYSKNVIFFDFLRFQRRNKCQKGAQTA